MDVQRLAWAGARLATPAATAYVDLLGAPHGRTRALVRAGPPPIPPTPRPDTALAFGVVTHVHDDHYDPHTLREVLGPDARVVCPPGMAEQVAGDGLRPQALSPWEAVAVGDLRVTAVPAVDGLGDDQVSYVVEDGVHAVFHGGDTLWHGHWWRIAERWPRLTLALLPVNGPTLELPDARASGIEAVLTPEQAVAAAYVLGAGALCPIHYTLFHRPPYYVETPDLWPRLERAAARRGVRLAPLAPGERWVPDDAGRHAAAEAA